jgi:hypothetical protein
VSELWTVWVWVCCFIALVFVWLCYPMDKGEYFEIQKQCTVAMPVDKISPGKIEPCRWKVHKMGKHVNERGT